MVKFFNTFGIIPSKSYNAAGFDFYIPNIDDTNETQVNKFKEEIVKTHCVTLEQLDKLHESIVLHSNEMWWVIDDNDKKEIVSNNIWNIIHLYLSYVNKSSYETQVFDINNNVVHSTLSRFLVHSLIVDYNKKRVGIQTNKGDNIIINTGIKECIENGYAGIFFNKSGRGLDGWTMGACVVDCDYSGAIVVNMNFLSNAKRNGKLFCGDKITQQVIVPIMIQREPIEIDKDEFEKFHKSSERGDNGFGSTNNK